MHLAEPPIKGIFFFFTLSRTEELIHLQVRVGWFSKEKLVEYLNTCSVGKM